MRPLKNHDLIANVLYRFFQFVLLNSSLLLLFFASDFCIHGSGMGKLSAFCLKKDSKFVKWSGVVLSSQLIVFLGSLPYHPINIEKLRKWLFFILFFLPKLHKNFTIIH